MIYSHAARIRAARAQVALDKRMGRESKDWVLALAAELLPTEKK